MHPAPSDSRLFRYLSFSPLLVAFLLCICGPALFFVLNYQYLHAEIESISRIHASLVNDAINKNPAMWQYEDNKLRMLVGDRLQHDAPRETLLRRIELSDGTVLAESGGQPAWPTICESTELFDARQAIGQFYVATSLRGTLIGTGIVALACLVISGFIIYSLRVVPMRAIEKSYEQLSFLANCDTLTGLANRHCFMAQLELAIAQARRDRTHLLLLFIDLDDFKQINDQLGHHCGDQLLQTLGHRIKDVIRRSDIAGRLGGDEFVVCFTQLEGNASASGDGDMQYLARQIRDAINEPITLAENVVTATSSIGLARFPEDGQNAASLLRAADTAMYDGKMTGKDGFRFFSEAQTRAPLERLQIIADLPQAIARNEFTLAYQPIYSAQSHTIAGVEALVRWQHPELGNISANRLIHIAEETGHIVQLGYWVLSEACRQNKAWQDAGHPPISIGVNVSPAQFTHPGFLDAVDDALATSQLAPEYLELEITESLIIADLDRAFLVMEEITRRGIGLAIDDFGTGYSALNHLKRFPVGKLKIDQTFVNDLPESGEDQLIIRMIIMLAKELNMQVVAEGVENPEQVKFLCEHDCDLMQGFFFSLPVAADQVFTPPASTIGSSAFRY